MSPQRNPSSLAMSTQGYPLRHRLEAAGVFLLRGVTALLPLRRVALPGAAMGWLLYAVLRVTRGTTLRNLAIAFGELPEAERSRLAGASYRFFGGLIWEFLSLPRIPPDRMDEFVALEGLETLRQALAEGRGVILVSGHLGNWELMPAALARAGLPVSMYVGGQRNALVDGAMNAIRRALGSRTIGRDNLRGLLRALKERHVVALLADQYEMAKRWFVAFFGQPVSVVSGPAQLLRRSGAALVFGACVREGPFRYRARFKRLALPPQAADEERDVLNISQLIFDELEAAVRRNPEQYFWMHRRFRVIGASAHLTESNRAFLAERGVTVPPYPPEK
jgi:KDO2-lipid IV(A) lauroyltransferase